MPKPKLCSYPEHQDKCYFGDGQYCKSDHGVPCIYKYFKDYQKRKEGGMKKNKKIPDLYVDENGVLTTTQPKIYVHNGHGAYIGCECEDCKRIRKRKEREDEKRRSFKI